MSEATDAERLAEYDLKNRLLVKEVNTLVDENRAAIAREQTAIKERDAEYERANRLNQTAIEQSTEATTYAAANAKLTKERDEILEREKAYVSSALNVKLELAKLTEENRVLNKECDRWDAVAKNMHEECEVLKDKLRVAVEALDLIAGTHGTEHNNPRWKAADTLKYLATLSAPTGDKVK